MTDVDRKPTADEQAGIAWWNALSEPRRADWLRLCGSAKPADAWAEYKRHMANDGGAAASP